MSPGWRPPFVYSFYVTKITSYFIDSGVLIKPETLKKFKAEFKYYSK